MDYHHRTPTAHRTRPLCALIASCSMMCLNGCSPSEPNNLDNLGTVAVTLKSAPVQLWIADDNDERQRGLMFVTADQMKALPDGTRRGMIFVFDFEQVLSFWMKNTIIPLDIAYLDSSGKVTATHTMPALDDRIGLYTSVVAARYAIELNKDVLGEIGLVVGDTVEIPASLLNRIP